MKCEDAQEFVTALVDEELSHLERASMEVHLEDCPRCRWAYEQERALKREIHKVGVSISVPADLKRRILADHGIARKERESSEVWNKIVLLFRPFFRPAFGLACCSLFSYPRFTSCSRIANPFLSQPWRFRKRSWAVNFLCERRQIKMNLGIGRFML